MARRLAYACHQVVEELIAEELMADAFALLNQSLLLDPGYIPVRRQLGQVLLEAGQPRPAIIHLEAAIRAGQSDADLLSAAGVRSVWRLSSSWRSLSAYSRRN